MTTNLCALIKINFLNFDSFSEAVSSPHPQVPQQLSARFTFNEGGGGAGGTSGASSLAAIVGSAATQSATVRPGSTIEGGMDDTRIDLTQLDPSAAGPSSVSMTNRTGEAAAAVSAQLSAAGGTSTSEAIEVATTEVDAVSGAAVSQVIADDEAIAGPSGQCAMVAEIVETVEIIDCGTLFS